MVNNKVPKVGALEAVAQRFKAEIPTKLSELSNDAGYQTEEQMMAAVNAKLSSTYRPGGSAAFADLPALTEASLGLVVNVTDKFTTTESFLEGAGKEYPAGTNVAVVQVGKEYKYDVMAGFLDTSGLVKKEAGKGLSTNDFTDEARNKVAELEFAADEEIEAMLDGIFGA